LMHRQSTKISEEEFSWKSERVKFVPK
jgi:hypothetical protein